ncbi:MAG: hypothetical protein IPM29_20280 [Planctomycetes bacterium]|nr:hypothetical protein [Planctomycetota bacterium]
MSALPPTALPPTAGQPPRRMLLVALATLAALALASPPGAFPGAGLLVLAGLALLYLLVTAARRPYGSAYLVGAAHLLGFSLSLRFVSVPAWVAIGLVGGLYFALTAAWARSFARFRLGGLGFGLGVAATAWIRSHVPEIPYPHAQPIHALYHWPALLGPLAWGGEVLGNLLLATLAAQLVELARGWRLGVPPFRRALLQVAVPLLAWGAGCAFAPPRPPGAPVARPLRVALVEPGLDGLGLSPLVSLAEEAWPGIATAMRQLGDAAGPAPDLVVWPEGALPGELVDGEPGDVAGPLASWLEVLARGPLTVLADGAQLWAGTRLGGAEGGSRGAVAAFDRAGRLLGWNEKLHPVPGGERIPFVDLLPRGVLEALVAAIGVRLHYLPDMAGGSVRAPLPVGPERVPVAGLLCFDNAFDDAARAAVASGARALVVASNEAWYRHGAELHQMVAMSVCRAIETATPVLRSTVDGSTAHIDARGRIAGMLPLAPGVRGRVLLADAQPGPGGMGRLGSVHAALGPLALLSGLVPFGAVLLGALRRRRRAAGNPVATQP